MLSREREREFLRECETALAQARSDIETLPPIIESLRKRLGVDAAEDAEADARRLQRSAAKVVKAIKYPGGSFAAKIPTYRGRPVATAFMEMLIGEHGRSHADKLVELVQTAEPFRDDPPSRNTLMTRLNELASRGRLLKFPDGTYDLAQRADDDLGPNRADENAVEPRVQTEGSNSTAEAPGREDDRFPSGAPQLESAPGDRDRVGG